MRLAVLDLAGAVDVSKREWWLWWLWLRLEDVTKFWRFDVDLARQKGFLKYWQGCASCHLLVAPKTQILQSAREVQHAVMDKDNVPCLGLRSQLCS